jgi:rod shape-determining protein MreC
VARVVRVERRADSAFARIYCIPLAQVQGARHVVVLKPLADNELARPEPAPAVPANKRGGRK